MRTLVMLGATLFVVAVASPLADAEPPPPEPEALVLKAEEKTVGVPVGTEAEGRLEGVGGCTFLAEGEILENKQATDVAGKFEKRREFTGSNCRSNPTEENIEKVFVSTSNILSVVGEHMKYRTTSPKCTYKTALYQGEFAIPGLVVATVTATGERIAGESESGCATTKTVEATAKLFDRHGGLDGPFYAIRKSEK